VDLFAKERVFELREEIAQLKRANESYQRQRYHPASEIITNELRRVRLLAIRDELLRLNGRSNKSE
jgi:hypothetical protein